MEEQLRKIGSTLALSLVAFMNVVSAVDDMQMRNLENRVSSLEKRRGANGMINPPARPVVKDGVDLWIQGEALLMKVTEDGLSYAILTNNNAIPPNVGLSGNVQDLEYSWNWGFRFGVGYNLPHDGWDLLLNWTWFRSSNSEFESTPFSRSIDQTYTGFFPFSTQVGFAKGRSHLHFDFLDFEMGREFFVSKWLTLRPFMGARGTWVTRTFKIKYSRPENQSFDYLKDELQSRFRGGGLRLGLDTQWGLGCGWSFFAGGAASLIYGNQKLHQYQISYLSGNGAKYLNVYHNWLALRFLTDLGTGLRWDHLFCEDRYRIRLQLQWEEHLLIGFNKDMNFSSESVKFDASRGDLGFSGPSFQMRFDF